MSKPKRPSGPPPRIAFLTTMLGDIYGDSLRYQQTPDGLALEARLPTFFETLIYCGVAAARRPRHQRPIFVHEHVRGWRPAGFRKSLTGRVKLVIPGRLTQGDVELLLAFDRKNREAAQ